MRTTSALLLLALITIASAATSQTRLSVIQPTGLVDEIREYNKKRNVQYTEEDGNVIECELANFGSVQYGSRTMGVMHISQPYNACNKTEVERDTTDHYTSRIPFLLIERGGQCGFVDKVYNAQEVGAQIVVIVDNIKERGNVVMVDNGHGKNVHITSVFISKSYGDIIKQYTEKFPTASVFLSLELSQKKLSESKALFWIDLASPLSKDMIKSFNKIRKTISANKFTTEPIFAITRNANIKTDSDCKIVRKTQFCAPDPDLHQNPGQASTTKNVATGEDVLNEAVRQFCVYQESGEEVWYDYYIQFANDCSHQPQYYQSCGANILKDIKGLNSNKVETCISSEQAQYSILSSMADRNQQFKIFEWPAVTVNDMLYKGNLDGHGIAEAICNSLESTDDYCNKVIDPDYTAIKEQQNNKSGDSSIMWTLFLILIGFIVLFFLMTFAYKKIVKREISQDMNQQVNSMVSQYIAFYESRGKGNTDQSEL